MGAQDASTMAKRKRRVLGLLKFIIREGDVAMTGSSNRLQDLKF